MDIAWTSDLDGVDANGLISNTHRGGENPGIIASEEPSALNAMSSLRESSEHICSRVALRIAFLICFAEGYHRNKESIAEEFGDENIHCNIMVDRSNAQTKTKGIKQSSQKDGCFEGHLALEHARELLGVVFAGQGSTVASTCGFLLDEYNSSDNSFLSGSVNSTVIEDVRSKNKALSFAMRHRALRVASILCPHDVILRVILEEGYATGVCDDHLNKYAFGSFVAMEIEAMGLPLPHSDLVQLSEMHFPSFARTIWRNHGGGSYQGFTGRLHLILLELCVSDRDSIDWELLILVFKELMRFELPRSLILASECVAKSEAFESAISQNREDVILNAHRLSIGLLLSSVAFIIIHYCLFRNSLISLTNVLKGGIGKYVNASLKAQVPYHPIWWTHPHTQKLSTLLGNTGKDMNVSKEICRF